MKSLMVDIETLATTDDAAVVAIGACLFDANEILDSAQWLIDPKWAVGHRNERTYCEFWMNREEVPLHVYNKMLGGTQPPWEICVLFAHWVKEHNPKQCWANPPQFDLVILRSMFRQCDLSYMFPIHYKQERDCRTMFQIAKAKGIDLRHTRDGLDKHNAEHDAIAQAKAIQIINREIV